MPNPPTPGDDIIIGDDGANLLRGGSGDDLLVGGGGLDALSGGTGNDILSGGGGVDILRGGAGDDYLNGGKDYDRAVYQGDLADYSIWVDSSGRLHIDDSVFARDGNDVVKNVESFNFNGTIYTYFEVSGQAFTGI